jgi:hypothetical protein
MRRCVMGDVFNRLQRVLVLGLSVLLCLTGSTPLKAQSNAGDAAVTGTVLDPDGKVIQNAAITLKSESTSLVRNFTTDAEGRFSTAGLSAGIYTIDVSSPGFATAHRTGLQLTAGATHYIHFENDYSSSPDPATGEPVSISRTFSSITH